MKEIINDLYEIISQRKNEKIEGSYTCYLFEKGIDKILKKCGEECSEIIIASKNEDKEEIINEICDFIYHLLVLMVEQNISVEEIREILEQRREKIGNLKNFYQSNKNS